MFTRFVMVCGRVAEWVIAMCYHGDQYNTAICWRCLKSTRMVLSTHVYLCGPITQQGTSVYGHVNSTVTTGMVLSTHVYLCGPITQHRTSVYGHVNSTVTSL